MPRIPRATDHLERCSMAYSNQHKICVVRKENFSRRWYRSTVMTHNRFSPEIGFTVPTYVIAISIDGKSPN